MAFPETIRRLPYANLAGADVYVQEGEGRQILFMEVPADHAEVVVPRHTHGTEWGIVVEGEIEMTIGDRVERHPAGSTHHIPAQVPHSFRFRPGTSSIHVFEERRVPNPGPPKAGGAGPTPR